LNQSVGVTSNDLSVVQTIAKQLRVPELSYRMDSSDKLEVEIQSFFLDFKYVYSVDGADSALKNLTATFAKMALPVTLNNFAFISDRIFDVWGRKNRLNNDVNAIVKTWRHPFFKVMHQSADIASSKSFIEFVERVSNDTLVWEPRPERSKRILLDELSCISALLFQLECKDIQELTSLHARWQDFTEKQSTRVLKVVERLKVLEARQSWAEYCELCVKSYLNGLFLGQPLTGALQKFISNHWVKVLANSIEKQLNPHIEAEIQTLTAKIKAVFCTKGKAAFKWVDNLLDDLQVECSKNDIKVDDSIWQEIEADLVNILQGNEVEEGLFLLYKERVQRSISFDVVLDSHIIEGRWFYSVKDSIESREQVVAIFPECQEVLFCNYLGIKSRRCTYEELNLELSSQTLKLLVADSNFIEVVQKTNAGLLKVAQTQQKARAIAAEKARKEAEHLLEEKEQAEKMAKVKAKEIAEQTKQLLKKRIDKQRAEQENEALSSVSNCKLGAWISVMQKGGDNKAQRFKLVVKFAASNKFIFVDRLGVKKIEYTEADLIKGIMNTDIEILSDGVEFEESLERVVSRLRMTK
jgi:hypothetical protein